MFFPSPVLSLIVKEVRKRLSAVGVVLWMRRIPFQAVGARPLPEDGCGCGSGGCHWCPSVASRTLQSQPAVRRRSAVGTARSGHHREHRSLHLQRISHVGAVDWHRVRLCRTGTAAQVIASCKILHWRTGAPSLWPLCQIHSLLLPHRSPVRSPRSIVPST